MNDLLHWLIRMTETINRLKAVQLNYLVCLVAMLCMTRIALAALTGQ